MRRQSHLGGLLSSNILLDVILLVDHCVVGSVIDRLGLVYVDEWTFVKSRWCVEGGM
jgi:hypothetical protein